MEHEKLIKHLAQKSKLTLQQATVVASQALSRDYKKGDFFLQAPAICNEIAYVISGVFRYYYINEQGEEVTVMFMHEGDFFTDLESLSGKTPSEGFIQAETDANASIFSSGVNEHLKATIKDWAEALRDITKYRLIEQLKLTRQLITLDAKEAYAFFRRNYPTVVGRVPDSHVASFLGISKFTLSRVKKNISKN